MNLSKNNDYILNGCNFFNAVPGNWKNDLKHSDTYSQNLALLDHYLVKSNDLFHIEKIELRELY